MKTTLIIILLIAGCSTVPCEDSEVLRFWHERRQVYTPYEKAVNEPLPWIIRDRTLKRKET